MQVLGPRRRHFCSALASDERIMRTAACVDTQSVGRSQEPLCRWERKGDAESSLINELYGHEILWRDQLDVAALWSSKHSMSCLCR